MDIDYKSMQLITYNITLLYFNMLANVKVICKIIILLSQRDLLAVFISVILKSTVYQFDIVKQM